MDTIGQVLDRKERPAYVTFHREAKEDKAEGLRQGKYVAKDVDYVHITPAYSKDIIIKKVSDWFDKLEGDIRNSRIAPEWVKSYKDQYAAWQNGQELPPVGTAVRGWGVISPATQEMLIRINILTVEDLAHMNEEGIRRVGMGGVDLKVKATAWLQQMNDKGPLTQEISAVKARNRELESSMETLQRQVKSLMAISQQAPEPAHEERDEITATDILDTEPTHEELVSQYTAKFNKPPHHRKSDATLKSELGL